MTGHGYRLTGNNAGGANNRILQHLDMLFYQYLFCVIFRPSRNNDCTGTVAICRDDREARSILCFPICCILGIQRGNRDSDIDTITTELDRILDAVNIHVLAEHNLDPVVVGNNLLNCWCSF